MAEKKDCLVKIQDLTCYWDMASFLFFFFLDCILDDISRLNLSESLYCIIKFFLQVLEAPTLQNVSLTVKSEQLVAVIGPVGAGKVCSSVQL